MFEKIILKIHKSLCRHVGSSVLKYFEKKRERGISKQGRASILSACIQQRSNVHGTLAKVIEFMLEKYPRIQKFINRQPACVL